MFSYPHMCRRGHIEIGHADSEHELCPLCLMIDESDKIATEARRLRVQMTLLAADREALIDERQDLLIRLEGYRNASRYAP